MKLPFPVSPAQRRKRSQKGFTLIATIMILALLVVLLVGSFATNNTELAVSRSHFNDYRTTLAAESAFRAATRKAFRQIEKSGDFVVFRRQQTGSSASHLRPVVYLTAAYDPATNQWQYQPLISGAKTTLTTSTLVPRPGGNTLETAVMDTGEKFSDFTKFVPGTGAGGWSDTPLAPRWEYLDFRPDAAGTAPLSANPNDPRAKGQDLRVRYCYWVEDLAGKLDGDLVGNTSGPNFTHLRGQPAKSEDQLRQVALYTLFPPTPGIPGTTFPNLDNSTTSTQDNDLVNKRHYALTNDTYKQVGMSTTAAELMLKKNINFSMPAGVEHEVIPRKASIAASMWGKPKLAINKLIERAEGDTSPTGSGERHAAITELAEHIKSSLPNFARTRAGGNVMNTGLNSAYQGAPYGKLMTEDEYVYSLAANIIDYADRDQTPSVDPSWVKSTTTTGYGPGDINVPKYRGIDLQPFCVGYATRFLNSAWDDSSVTMQVSVWVALWNPTDREIEGDLEVRFTEGRTVVNCMLQGENIAGGSRPTLPHLNLPLKHISLGPNECIHVPWYDVHTLRATGLAKSRIQDPNFRMCPDDAAGIQSLFDGGYQIFWNGKLADRTRRPDNINRPYRQPGSTNDKAGLGKWFFASSGIGDSSQPAGDPRGTLYTAGLASSGGDASGNRGYYYREAKYINNCLWGGGAVKSTFGDSFNPSQWLSDPGHQTQPNQFNIAPLETETPDIHLQQRPVTTPPLPEKAPSHVKHPVDDYPANYTGPGYYESLGELGFVFDPNAWTRATGGGSQHFQGGGSTLRIGSPELAPFNTPGTRASDLLDILCLDEKRTFKGLVNINSASPEVIRSLVAGVEIRGERAVVNGVETSTDGIVRNGGMTSGSVFHPCSNINTGAGSVLAKGISDLAAANPGTVLATPGDLSALMVANPSSPSTQIPYFGNVNSWPTVATADIPSPPTMRPMLSGADPGLDDRGREEFYRRLLPLVTFQSRTFRMYLVTQVLDKNGNVVGMRPKVMDILLEPIYNAAGKVIGQDVQTAYEKNL
jgi:hypothetical protein